MEELAKIYWYPLYAFVRRHGHSPHEAEDLTQDFFATLIDKRALIHVEQSKGKFRTFLLTCLQYFLSNERNKQQAQKRGGGRSPVPLENAEAEHRYIHEPMDELTPERLFERRWALTVLEQTLDHLRQEYIDRGKTAMFDVLKPALVADPRGAGYRQLAEQLNQTEGSIKTHIHRMRLRYGELLRREITRTVMDGGQIDDELKYLMKCL
ncbi:MAG: RNA polymerase sigma factor [Phycisphaerales bacterium]